MALDIRSKSKSYDYFRFQSKHKSYELFWLVLVIVRFEQKSWYHFRRISSWKQYIWQFKSILHIKLSTHGWSCTHCTKRALELPSIQIKEICLEITGANVSDYKPGKSPKSNWWNVGYKSYITLGDFYCPSLRNFKNYCV